MSSVVCLSVQYSSMLSHNGTILEKQLLDINSVFRLSIQHLSEIFFILRRSERNMIKQLRVYCFFYVILTVHRR